MTDHPVTTAFADATWLPATIRQALAAGFAWTIASADDLRNLDIGAAGLTVRAVILAGEVFTYDAADTTTADDGVTCIVSDDNKRFKTGSVGSAPFAVKSSTTATPPGSPALGDWYRIPAAPTGDWAANADDLTVWTGNGWVFASPMPGWLVYARDTKVYEHWSEDGAWVEGIGSSTLAAGSVVPAKLEWPLGIAVEAEQAAPPGGTPAAGTAYIVGSSATGAWSGQDTDLARADGAGAWTFLSAYEGAGVHDKNLGVNRVFRSGAWETAAGAYVGRYQQRGDASADGTVESAGFAYQTTTGYQYSQTTAPTTSAVGLAIDAYQPTVAAKKAGAEFEYEVEGRIRFQLTGDGGSNKSLTLTTVGLFVDSETDARDWFPCDEVPAFTGATNGAWSTWAPFARKLLLFSLADTSDHVIKLRFFFRVYAGSSEESNLAGLQLIRRRSIIREAF